MLNNITRNRLLGFWFAAVAVIIATVVVTGAHVGLATAALLLALSIVPPGIILVLWPAAPAQTIGDILYTGNARRDRP